jgi:predicted nuclease with TOPRIM domain
LIGVAVGALLALLSSIGLESRRSRQRLLSAIEVVITELDEDQGRLRTKGRLTLGDWEQNKETLSQLAVKRPRLWEMLARTYGKMYESKRWAEQEPPTKSELTDLTSELANYADESLVKRIVYATLYRRSDRAQIKRQGRSRLAGSGVGTAHSG